MDKKEEEEDIELTELDAVQPLMPPATEQLKNNVLLFSFSQQSGAGAFPKLDNKVLKGF